MLIFRNVGSFLSATQNVAADLRFRYQEQQAKEEENSREKVRERERQERQENMAATLQTVQLNLLNNMSNKTVGRCSVPWKNSLIPSI